MNWDFMSKMFYPKLGGNAVKWQEHKTQKPELNPSSLPVRGFPCGSNGKQSACNVGDPGLIPGSGRSPGEGNGNSFQYSCLGNAMDREAWWATVHVDMTKQQLTPLSLSLPVYQLYDHEQFNFSEFRAHPMPGTVLGACKVKMKRDMIMAIREAKSKTMCWMWE